MEAVGFGVCFDATDPAGLAGFWAHVLGRELVWSRDGEPVLQSPDATGFPIRFTATQRHKSLQNWAHFDLTSTSLEDQRRTAGRALDAGGRHIDIGQGPQAEHLVMADPEGNEFCVIEPGNRFLADTGPIGALACDGSPAVGHFWRDALGWRMVWDQGQETAIQAPYGGPKISWGGPSYPPRDGLNRLRYEIVVPAGADLDVEVARLAGLGATRLDDGRDSSRRVGLTDPDGNEFTVEMTTDKS